MYLFLFIILSCNVANAKTQDIYPLTPEQNIVFSRLSTELRCMVCQNQSLADSNADLAIQMREKIYQQLLAGKSEREIINYLLLRYGDFILLDPRPTAKTLPLWLFPLLILFAGLTSLTYYIRKRV